MRMRRTSFLWLTVVLATSAGRADGALRPGRGGMPESRPPSLDDPVPAARYALRRETAPTARQTAPVRPATSRRGEPPSRPAPAADPPEATPTEPAAPARAQGDAPAEPIPTVVLPPLDLSLPDPAFEPGPSVIELPPLVLVLPSPPPSAPPRPAGPPRPQEPAPSTTLPAGTPPGLLRQLAATPAFCPANWLELYQDWALAAETDEDAAEAGRRAEARLAEAMEPADLACEEGGGHLFWRAGLAAHHLQRSPVEPDEVQDIRARTGVCCAYTGCADECRMTGHPAGGFFPAGCPQPLEESTGPLGGFDGCCCVPHETEETNE